MAIAYFAETCWILDRKSTNRRAVSLCFVSRAFSAGNRKVDDLAVAFHRRVLASKHARGARHRSPCGMDGCLHTHRRGRHARLRARLRPPRRRAARLRARRPPVVFPLGAPRGPRRGVQHRRRALRAALRLRRGHRRDRCVTDASLRSLDSRAARTRATTASVNRRRLERAARDRARRRPRARVPLSGRRARPIRPITRLTHALARTHPSAPPNVSRTFED